MEFKQLSVLLLGVLMAVSQPISFLEAKKGSEEGSSTKSAKSVGLKKKDADRLSKKSKKTSEKKSPKKKKKRRGKKQKKAEKKSIATGGKFSVDSGMKSFRKSADFLIDYMENVSKLGKVTEQDKNSLWTSIARYFHYTERVKAYQTSECNKIALSIFQEASKHEDLFNKSKMFLINKWIKQKQDSGVVAAEPEKKKSDGKTKKIGKGESVKKRTKIKKDASEPKAKKVEKRKKK